MNKVLIIKTSWYKDYIDDMSKIAREYLSNNFSIDEYIVPGSLELAAFAKNRMSKNEDEYIGVFFIGIIVRGETSHYDLISNQCFRDIGRLSLEYPNISIINNVICVDDKEQLIKRFQENTKNNVKGLIALINEKSC